MQPNNLQISLYSYRFISETLFPNNKQLKAKDVQPGGRFYCLTQVFLDKIFPEKIPVELVFIARASEPNFRTYKLPSQDPINPHAAKVASTFSQLTQQVNNTPELVATFLNRLHSLHQSLPEKKKPAEISPKFREAFEAVEQCLHNHPDKLAIFETILSDWSTFTPGSRARAINFDPFIRALWEAIKDISLL